MITPIILALALATALLTFVLSVSAHVEVVDSAAEEQAVARTIREHPRLRRFIAERLDRTKAGGLLLTLSFAVLFAVALVVGSLLDMIDRNEGIARLDKSVAVYGSEHSTSSATTVVKVVTQFGARPVVLGLALAVAVFEWWRTKRLQPFVFMAVVVLGEMILNNVLKVLVARERPNILRVVDAHGYSFPSGHSSAAAAAWAAAALVLSRNRPHAVRAAIGAVAVLIAVAVAASRALLGVHWLTDVIAGLALGWGWFTLVAIAFGGRRQQLGEPVERAVPEMSGVSS